MNLTKALIGARHGLSAEQTVHFSTPQGSPKHRCKVCREGLASKRALFSLRKSLDSSSDLWFLHWFSMRFLTVAGTRASSISDDVFSAY
jgi:hypothetical protein